MLICDLRRWRVPAACAGAAFWSLLFTTTAWVSAESASPAARAPPRLRGHRGEHHERQPVVRRQPVHVVDPEAAGQRLLPR